jgi:hypothetical protein
MRVSALGLSQSLPRKDGGFVSRFGYQGRNEEIANLSRFQFDLRE